MFNGISKEKFAELVNGKRISLMAHEFYKIELLDMQLIKKTLLFFTENMKPLNAGKVIEINEDKLIRHLDYYSFGKYKVIDKINIKEASYLKEENSDYFLVVTREDNKYVYVFYLRIEK